MYKNHKIGQQGEDIATEYLRKVGYKIIERNFVCKLGEIDIIAKDKKELVFIEIKTRTNNIYGLPKEAVNFIKKKHIYYSAEFYIYLKRIKYMSIRIDVIEIQIQKEKIKINHIKNAIIERP